MNSSAPPVTSVPASLLLSTQLVFNVGFYAVVPFLALVMTEDLGLGAAAVGLVLGARTFSQQGMFLFGGALADHWGPRRSIVIGCMVRALGYFGLATSETFWFFLLSAVLTGMGGAFFSPAVESLLGTLDRIRSAQDRAQAQDPETTCATPRRTLFAWLVLFGEVGAVLGPLVGLALLPFGFPIVAASAACLFLVVGAVLWLMLPSPSMTTDDDGPDVSDESMPSTGSPGGPDRAFECLRDRRFVCFAALFSVNLLAYNQLYFALPLDLTQGDGGAGGLAVMFILASTLTIVLQLPLSAAAARWGPTIALRVGFACMAAGLASMALLDGVGRHLPPGLPAMTGPVLLVILLILGHVLVSPVGLQQVHGFAGTRRLGAYYGLLASCGGVAVLLGNLLIGVLRDTLGSAAGWGLLVLLATSTALLLPRFLPVPMPARAPHRQVES